VPYFINGKYPIELHIFTNGDRNKCTMK